MSKALAANTTTQISVMYDKILVDPIKNSRKFAHTPKSIESLVHSIKTHNGLLQSVVVVPIPPDQQNGSGKEYQLVAGYRRMAALGQLVDDPAYEHLELVPATVLSVGDNQTLANVSENREREALNYADTMVAIENLMASGMDGKDIAKALHVNAGTVSVLKKASKLRDSIIKQIADGKIPFRGIRALVAVDEDEQDKLLAKVAKGKEGWSEAGEDAVNEAQSSGKATTRKYKAAAKKTKGTSGPRFLTGKKVLGAAQDAWDKIAETPTEKTKQGKAALEIYAALEKLVKGGTAGTFHNAVMAALDKV